MTLLEDGYKVGPTGCEVGSSIGRVVGLKTGWMNTVGGVTGLAVTGWAVTS